MGIGKDIMAVVGLIFAVALATLLIRNSSQTAGLIGNVGTAFNRLLNIVTLQNNGINSIGMNSSLMFGGTGLMGGTML